jgi:hypothetical protein
MLAVREGVVAVGVWRHYKMPEEKGFEHGRYLET